MIWINLKLKLLLVAVVVAAINAAHTDYYDEGVSIGQSDFNFPANLPYVNFKYFCDTLIVREVNIRGTFQDVKREDGNFYFNLRLQPNDEDARKMERNAMTFTLYVLINTTHNQNYIHGYMYYFEERTNWNIPVITDLHNHAQWLWVQHNATYNVGYDFELRIILQPSHILFILNHEVDNNTIVTTNNIWKHYYGYFYEENDEEDHKNEFTDSLFETVHIEGDAEIKSFQVKSGGSLIQSSDSDKIPSYVTFKPYEKKMFTAIDKIKENDRPTYKYLFYNQTVRDGTHEGYEYEINLRGTVLDPSKPIEFHFQQKLTTKLCNAVSIIGEFKKSEPNRITILGNNQEDCNKFYVPTYNNFEKYQTSYKSYNEKYSPSPFKKNTNYEMSVRRLSYSDKNDQCLSCEKYDDFHGNPRSSVQITIRVECRIYTWYVHVHPFRNIDLLRISGEMDTQEVVIIY